MFPVQCVCDLNSFLEAQANQFPDDPEFNPPELVREFELCLAA